MSSGKFLCLQAYILLKYDLLNIILNKSDWAVITFKFYRRLVSLVDVVIAWDYTAQGILPSTARLHEQFLVAGIILILIEFDLEGVRCTLREICTGRGYRALRTTMTMSSTYASSVVCLMCVLFVFAFVL